MGTLSLQLPRENTATQEGGKAVLTLCNYTCLGSCTPPSPVGRLSPSLPMLGGRAGPLLEWHILVHRENSFLETKNKIARDPRLCGSYRDILLSPWESRHPGLWN